MWKKVSLLAIVICAVTSMSYAGLVISLTAEGQADPQNVVIDHVGQQVTIDVWGILSSGTTGNGITQAAMQFHSVEDPTGGMWGDISGATHPAFILGSNGVQTNYDGNPDLEWGGPVGGSSNSNNFFCSGTSSVAADATGKVKMGSFVWTATKVTPGSISTSVLSAVPWISSSTQKGVYKYLQDGVTYSNITTDPGSFGTGATVTLTTVPEPATLVLLGMGALALVFVRRRK